MADEAIKAAAPSGGSPSIISVLGIVLICILAVFMVTSLNKMKVELIKLNQQVDTLVTTTVQNSMGAFQAVDADGKLLMRYTPTPMETMMGGDAIDGCTATPPVVE